MLFVKLLSLIIKNIFEAMHVASYTYIHTQVKWHFELHESGLHVQDV